MRYNSKIFFFCFCSRVAVRLGTPTVLEGWAPPEVLVVVQLPRRRLRGVVVAEPPVT